MDARELKKLIARGEGRTLEFKASFSNEAVETIAAKLPHGLTVPMLLRGDYPSTPRNTQIAEMFKEAGVIERYGSGIARIIKDFKEYGLAAPEFAEVG
ncbi:MAG TPA: hypothetical protein DDW67_02790, partial [Elusimicrobia bacterium]|nr:hypothetical protein [Elusimicrobiota bacterium]